MNPSPIEQIARIKRALLSIRIPATPGEYDLHEMIGCALCAADIDFCHEVNLAPRCRIDFLAGDIGIEVKQGKQPKKQLEAQVTRYLASPKLSALILITTRGAMIPGMVNGKPVEIVGLNRLWGVALP